ncbi:thioredoxin-disulfide reductase [Patescibacteria group bacterium]|jgi:thioredoxin reductase (NADPH)|nr:thioredoxin-disulfide reductase [Patescibacteria group bacterium]
MRSVAIIGSGPAGWTAAIYAARASLNPILFEGSEPGGQLMTTTEVENFPGFIHGIQGPELMQVLREQAKRFGTEIVSAMVESLKQVEGGFELVSNGQTYRAQTVILSTGATAKRLGLESEKRLYGRGVSACATCDGFFFKGKNVIVVGGGDSAMEESSFLTRFAEKVYLVHRRDSFRASKIMQDRVKANPKIEIIWNSEVTDILGEEKVTAAVLKNIVTGETREMPIDGVFAAIGHAPNISLVQGLVDLDEKGYVVTLPGSTRTNVPGLFACGDVQDAKYRQAITAAGTGCMAALDAERFLSGH